MGKLSNKQILKIEAEAKKNKRKLPRISLKPDIQHGEVKLSPKKYMNKKYHKLSSYYDESEVANLLNVSVNFVKKLVKDKKIKPVSKIRSCFFHKKSMNKFVANFKEKQKKALDTLAEETQKLNLTDDFPW